MVTIGLAKELYFVAHILKQKVEATVVVGGNSLKLDVNPDGFFDAFFMKDGTWYHIWHEKIEGEDSFFGLESCDSITRIIACIQNGSPWKHLAYHEKS